MHSFFLIILLTSTTLQAAEKHGQTTIVGGQIAAPNSWPWQVGLSVDGDFVCGGSLISDRCVHL